MSAETSRLFRIDRFAVLRAREEYYAHPIAACWVDGCEELAGDHHSVYCPAHEKDRDAAATRMRTRRAAT